MHKWILVMGTALIFGNAGAQVKSAPGVSQLPIGIFDSGTGGLTVMEAMLALDQVNNKTGQPGADGRPDFEGEIYQYLADQANMPYGNYAAEKKTDLLREHILKNMGFFLGQTYVKGDSRAAQTKPGVKMIVIACNTATAYALEDIKKFTLLKANAGLPVIGVIDAGSKAALQYQVKNPGTIGVFATAGTVASGGYPRTLRAMAAGYGLQNLSIVSQGGVGLAESIDRDWSYFADTATAPRPNYKGPSLKSATNVIDRALMEVYGFNNTYNKLLCEFDDKGNCTDVQLNDPANYVRYHLVSLLEKMVNENTPTPLNTLILGCTHYPYMRDTIRNVLHDLYNYQKGGVFRYRPHLAPEVALIDPAVETAKEAYAALYAGGLQQIQTPAPGAKNQFFIAVPNTALPEVQLQPDGWFTYDYKYGRTAGAGKNYVQYVPFDMQNVSAATYNRFRIALPRVYEQLNTAVGLQ